jgi:hypothetical protein
MRADDTPTHLSPEARAWWAKFATGWNLPIYRLVAGTRHLVVLATRRRAGCSATIPPTGRPAAAVAIRRARLAPGGGAR